ncbi:acetyltransferase [Vibrio vulnificus]|uniref:GNAT family N-acetyltransferase n=1 Tax=Vibrio vulnificus TaxID=672 RepID=UPI0004F59E36|nr:GNAT family N-acetyltransferase [Vibrio vulnificus]AIL70747.1 acetyltransferase [Vibrio vulnificus]PWY26821.1 GNAT family N-acetyltransferase [Vibrio vulnificus]
MEIVYEIDVTEAQHKSIEVLRNQSFPDHQSNRSYYKQLPHMRVLRYEDDLLVGYLGLDYRAIKVGDEVYNVLGIIDFCVAEQHRGKGIGSTMLSEVSSFAEGKAVDFIMLISELDEFYLRHGYRKVEGIQSWLRLHEHTNYGIAVEHIDELFIKPISGKQWTNGHIDWLGYMY